MSNVLVLDLHLKDPPFAGPRWFPEDAARTVRRVPRGERPPRPEAFSHVVVSGCALSITEDADFLPEVEACLRACSAAGIPVMGVCYGAQLLARVFYGRDHVRRSPRGVEVGWLPVEVLAEADGWFAGLPSPFHTWHFHYDEVLALPAGARVLARSAGCDVQAFDDPARRLFAVQFHPEMDVEEGNRCFRAEAAKIAAAGLDAEALVAATRDDGARRLFARFLEREW